MYLKKLSIENFRKFREHNNTIQFAASKDYQAEECLNIAPKTTLLVGKNNSGKTTIIEVLRRLLVSAIGAWHHWFEVTFVYVTGIFYQLENYKKKV